jgi:DNA-3-methyladenine glycosylase
MYLHEPNFRLEQSFFSRDVLEVAPGLLGCAIARVFPDGTISRYAITETEAYRGQEDLACHASKGLTSRTAPMFEQGGILYVYLVYGMHWMLNVVTGPKDHPEAVLIRGIDGAKGPGRVTRLLAIDKEFNSESLVQSTRIWIEAGEAPREYCSSPRIGIDYAGPIWKNMPWRYHLNS